MLNNENPWWLPKGSIRAMLAMGIVGAYMAGIPVTEAVLGMVLGFYFAKQQQ